MPIIARKRYPGEEWDVRQFVQPLTPGVRRIVAGLERETDFETGAWKWVVNNIRYPPGVRNIEDRHYYEAFLNPSGTGPLVRAEARDFWSFPAETLAHGWGDCEDASILLVSILRHRLSADEVFVTAGTFKRYGHAWVAVFRNGKVHVLETVPRRREKWRFRVVEERYPYEACFRFNDRKIQVVRGFCIAPKRTRDKLAAIEAFYAGLYRAVDK
ncbi:MAG: transglutaminase-like domain-containing protein [Desulfotomaculales bacterium]